MLSLDSADTVLGADSAPDHVYIAVIWAENMISRMSLKGFFFVLIVIFGMQKANAIQTLNYPELKFHVFTSEDDGFFDNSIIVEGKSKVMLIDAQLTRANAIKVLDTIKALGKGLELIYITHEHPDHFLGLEVFKQAFPNVRIVANSEVVSRIQKTYRSKLERWQSILGEKAATREVSITKFDADEINFEGAKIEIRKHLQGDTNENSYLWFSKERVAVVSDLVYDSMHVYAVETTPESRKLWIKNLDDLETLGPDIVIPGHSFANKNFDSNRAIDFTRQYLLVFERELSNTKSASEFKQRMKQIYPDAELFFGVERAAEKFFSNQ